MEFELTKSMLFESEKVELVELAPVNLEESLLTVPFKFVLEAVLLFFNLAFFSSSIGI
jgi:hypothetical protein